MRFLSCNKESPSLSKKKTEHLTVYIQVSKKQLTLVSLLQVAKLLYKQQHCVSLENGKKADYLQLYRSVDQGSMLWPLLSLNSTNNIDNVQID